MRRRQKDQSQSAVSCGSERVEDLFGKHPRHYGFRSGGRGAVREYLLNTQRDTARKNSVIMDGRDIGTVILPDAEIKIFLTASPQARAKRRYEELIQKGQTVTYEQVYNEMVERDTNDSTRALAPCVPADDAIILDNSNLTAEETVDEVLKIVKKKLKKASIR